MAKFSKITFSNIDDLLKYLNERSFSINEVIILPNQISELGGYILITQ